MPIRDSGQADGGSDAAVATDASTFDAGLQDAAPYGHVLYLNFSGGPLLYGAVNDAVKNVSSVSKNFQDIAVPAFMDDFARDATHATRQGVVDAISQQVAALYSPYDVQVVTRRPPLAAYTMVVVGGTQIDLETTALGFAGIATTFACGPGSVADRDVGFVVTDDNFGVSVTHPLPLPGTASVAAHEAGHMFGLDHNQNPQSTMSVGYKGFLGWAEGNVLQDTSSAHCARTIQNDADVLLANLGARVPRPTVPPPPDTTPPLLDIVSPLADSTISPTSAPCVNASDASGLRMVMLQTFIVSGSNVFVRHQSGRTSAPFVFVPEDTEGTWTYRFVAVDLWDNITERRRTVQVRNDAPSGPPCP